MNCNLESPSSVNPIYRTSPLGRHVVGQPGGRVKESYSTPANVKLLESPSIAGGVPDELKNHSYIGDV